MGEGIKKTGIEKEVEIILIKAEEFGCKRDDITINRPLCFQEVYLSGGKAVNGIVFQFILIYIDKMDTGAISYPDDNKITMAVRYLILMEPVLSDPFHGMDLKRYASH
jgi:hypothetical protein